MSINESSNSMSLLSASTNLFICAAGAGLLSFPFATASAGVLSIFLITLVCAAISIFTDLIYVSFLHFHFNLRKINHGSLDELCLLVLGKFGSQVAYLSVAIGCFGAIIGFLILIGDMIAPLVVDISRFYIISGFTFFIGIPLSSLNNLHHLFLSSLLAAATVIGVAITVFVKGITSSSVTDVSSYFFISSWRVVLAIPIAIFSLGNHSQVSQVALELFKKDEKLSTYIHWPILASTFLCVVVYLITGIGGFLAFSTNVQGDILLNFDIGNIAAVICRVSMAFHIALALPVLSVPLRTILIPTLTPMINLITKACWRRKLNQSSASGSFIVVSQVNEDDTVTSSSGLLAKEPENVSPSLPISFRILSSLIIMLPCNLIAVFIPQIAVVFGLLGSTVSTVQIYGLAGFMLVMHADSCKNLIYLSVFTPFQARLIGYLLIFLCIAIATLGTALNIYALF
jgi:amino acid permease